MEVGVLKQELGIISTACYPALQIGFNSTALSKPGWWAESQKDKRVLWHMHEVSLALSPFKCRRQAKDQQRQASTKLTVLHSTSNAGVLSSTLVLSVRKVSCWKSVAKEEQSCFGLMWSKWCMCKDWWGTHPDFLSLSLFADIPYANLSTAWRSGYSSLFFRATDTCDFMRGWALTPEYQWNTRLDERHPEEGGEEEGGEEKRREEGRGEKESKEKTLIY